MTEPNTPAVPAQDDNQIIAERREKLAAIRAQGIAFPNDFRPTHHAADLQAEYRETEQAALAGMREKRSQGWTLQRIATDLSDRCIPTKKGRSRWSLQAVANMLKHAECR